MIPTVRTALFISLIALAPDRARAQDTTQSQGKVDGQEIGLPSRVNWTFNFDAGWGNFGFLNSFYDNPKELPVEDLSDQWFEGYLKPALSGTYTYPSSSEVYGKVSAVGERTYGSVPPAFGADVSSFQAEDLYVGWKSGKSLTIGENALDFSVGRTQYRLGHGFLLFDGTAEGGSRGGYWSNARKAFQFAGIGRFKPGSHTVEAFYLDKDELEESDSASRLWGANYEYRIGEEDETTLGATYMRWWANELRPGRNGLDVYNVRAYTAPISAVPDLSFELESAWERNGDLLDSNAWTLLGAYEFSEITWTPKLSYRYAFFKGDDPTTGANESFDPLFLGFYDWGTWWQGEIAGEYFLSNSNLKSHLIRAHVVPDDSISGGLLFFRFRLDEPTAFGPQVTSSNVAFEIDAYADWKVNSNFTLSLIGAFADPGQAVEQFSGRTDNLTYGMVYVAYSF